MNTFMPYGMPIWHLCTNGENQPVLFNSTEDYQFAVNALAFSEYETNRDSMRVSLFAFCIMSNHIHLVIEGERDDCEDFFISYKNRLKRAGVFKEASISLFQAELIKINSMDQLKIEIAYVHRNPFVATKVIPMYYLWSSCMYYFNPLINKEIGELYQNIPLRAKRKIARSNIRCTLPENYRFLKQGIVSPFSFCTIDRAEALFGKSEFYWYKIARIVETESVLKYGDTLNKRYTDSELYDVVRTILAEDYPFAKSFNELSQKQLISIAKTLRFKYHAGNTQIARVMRIDAKVVDYWFR